MVREKDLVLVVSIQEGGPEEIETVPPMVLSSPRAQLLTARWGDAPGSFISITNLFASSEKIGNLLSE